MLLCRAQKIHVTPPTPLESTIARTDGGNRERVPGLPGQGNDNHGHFVYVLCRGDRINGGPRRERGNRGGWRFASPFVRSDCSAACQPISSENRAMEPKEVTCPNCGFKAVPLRSANPAVRRGD